jgi:WbqC-like protein family
MPWMGYFEQIARSDVYIILDTVQFEKQSWQNRNRLKGNKDQPFWLTIPVLADSHKALINEIRFNPNKSNWKRKHIESIRIHLKAAPFFDVVFPPIEEWLSKEYELLVELNIAGIKMFCEMLGLAPNFMRSSDMNPIGSKTDLVISLCNQVKATRYYSAAGSKEYMEQNEHLFVEAGIELIYQNWAHPVYAQRGNGFISHLSIIDALSNIGPEQVRSYIMQTE